MNIIMEAIYYSEEYQYLLTRGQTYIHLNLMEQRMKRESTREEIFSQTISMYQIYQLTMRTNLTIMI